MQVEEFVSYDGLGLAELVEKGEVAPTELLDLAIAQIQSTNDEVNAVVTPMWEQARDALASNLPQGPFHGVPFLLKDLGQLYTGVVTSNGSRLFKDNVADHDSTLVQRYKAAGLVICGKTNTPEFGLATTTEPALHGPTHNPWNTKHSTGGSSGGAAAAVAAGYVPMAHASDGGGSIRIPASCCGLFGLKPTRGRVPLGPDALEGWGGLSTVHAVTRTVRDSAALLDCSAGEELGSPYAAPPPLRPYLEEVGHDPGKLRIGLCVESFTGALVDPEVSSIAEQSANAIAALGHDSEIARPDIDTQAHTGAHGVLAISHIGAMLDAYAEKAGRPVTEQDVELVTWGNYQLAHATTGASYAGAVGTIHQLGLIVARYFERYDLLLTPTMACLPPKIGTLDMMNDNAVAYIELLYRMIAFTALFNDTGHPAMSVPLGLSRSGLPVGVQLVASFGNEALLFRTAAQLEQAGLFIPLTTLAQDAGSESSSQTINKS
ncbi:MAG: amidase [Gammaproteobacteria bacterium]|nr:amidase [Gammaproteobacteria bacterium]